MQVKKQQLGLDMEQQTGSKSGKAILLFFFLVFVIFVYWHVGFSIFVNFLWDL